MHAPTQQTAGPRRPARLRRFVRSRAGRVALVLFALALGWLAWAAAEPFFVTVADYRFASSAVPSHFDGVRIAFLADVHRGPYMWQSRLHSIIDRVNNLKPDLIVLGGDYVHLSGRYIAPAFAELARLHAPLGVYGVLGNHDHWEGAGQTRRAMARAGIVDLDNRAVWVWLGADRIRLGGVGDLQTDTQDLGPTLRGTRTADFVVLVSHNPDYNARVPAGSVDLMLAGHTHGGQLTFFGRWAPFVPSKYGQRYRSGLVKAGPVPIIISNGVGTTTPPLRFFARPQIVLVTLARSR
jgi:hypothetical protein